MQKHHLALSSYHFKRAKTDGVIHVLNEGSYIMAEYSERTGVVKWQRVVLAAQREKIEKWLGEHYPVQTAASAAAAAAAAPSASAAAASKRR
jgi:hypothetical protein